MPPVITGAATDRKEAGIATDDVGTLASWIGDADMVLVGADTGLSVSAGMSYGSERFAENFPEFADKYGMDRMLLARRERFPDIDEYWAYWSRLILINRYEFEDNGTYSCLRRLLSGKDYFVITASTDHCFQRFGFDPDRVFCPQGDYGLCRCSGGCCMRTFPNREQVVRMCAECRGTRVPVDSIPHCPECGAFLEPNVRLDDGFVVDDGWRESESRFKAFAGRAAGARTLYLEVGVGPRLMDCVTRPFMCMTAANPESRHASVGGFDPGTPMYLCGRTLHVPGDIRSALRGTLAALDNQGYKGA